MFRTPKVLPLGAAVVALVLIAGCGGSSKSSNTTAASTPAPAATTPAATAPAATTPASSGGGTVTLSADPSQLAFNTTKLTAKAGSVTLKMSNPAMLQHGVAIEGNGVNKSGNIVGNGGTSTVTATLKPGTYTFFCPVPGHRQAGMQGTLTVS